MKVGAGVSGVSVSLESVEDKDGETEEKCALWNSSDRGDDGENEGVSLNGIPIIRYARLTCCSHVKAKFRL